MIIGDVLKRHLSEAQDLSSPGVLKLLRLARLAAQNEGDKLAAQYDRDEPAAAAGGAARLDAASVIYGRALMAAFDETDEPGIHGAAFILCLVGIADALALEAGHEYAVAEHINHLTAPVPTRTPGDEVMTNIAERISTIATQVMS